MCIRDRLTIDYPEETVRTLILGLLAQSRKQLLSMEQLENDAGV